MVEKWEDYVERTSKYATLQAAKHNMVNQIEQSRTRQVNLVLLSAFDSYFRTPTLLIIS